MAVEKREKETVGKKRVMKTNIIPGDTRKRSTKLPLKCDDAKIHKKKKMNKTLKKISNMNKMTRKSKI